MGPDYFLQNMIGRNRRSNHRLPVTVAMADQREKGSALSLPMGSILKDCLESCDRRTSVHPCCRKKKPDASFWNISAGEELQRVDSKLGRIENRGEAG